MAEGFAKWAKEAKNKKYVIAIGLIIILIVLLTFMPLNTGGQKQPAAATVKQLTSKEDDDYETALEGKLSAMLTKMEGVGSVSVMVTTVSSEEKVLAEDTTSNTQKTEENDQSGGTRMTENSQLRSDVVLQNGNTPYVIKEYAPEIKGVLILAEGANNSVVKNQIIEAVAKLLDVPVHKISVEKKKN